MVKSQSTLHGSDFRRCPEYGQGTIPATEKKNGPRYGVTETGSPCYAAIERRTLDDKSDVAVRTCEEKPIIYWIYCPACPTPDVLGDSLLCFRRRMETWIFSVWRM